MNAKDTCAGCVFFQNRHDGVGTCMVLLVKSILAGLTIHDEQSLEVEHGHYCEDFSAQPSYH